MFFRCEQWARLKFNSEAKMKNLSFNDLKSNTLHRKIPVPTLNIHIGYLTWLCAGTNRESTCSTAAHTLTKTLNMIPAMCCQAVQYINQSD